MHLCVRERFQAFVCVHIVCVSCGCECVRMYVACVRLNVCEKGREGGRARPGLPPFRALAQPEWVPWSSLGEEEAHLSP